MSQQEFITASRFYFNADGLNEKVIQSFDPGTVETPATEQVQGCGKFGKVARQATPTVTKPGTIKIKVPVSQDKDLHKWRDDCQGNNNEANQWFKTGRRNASISAFTQDNQLVYQLNYTQCYPKSCTPPQFDAASPGIAFETFELEYETYTREK